MRYAKSVWHFILGFFLLIGGIWTCIQVWDRFPEYHRYFIAEPTPEPAPLPPIAKKKVETGSLPKPDPEPDFLAHPWQWFEWNHRQNEKKCAANTEKPRWCSPWP